MANTKDCKEFLGAVSHAKTGWRRVGKSTEGRTITRVFQHTHMHWLISVIEDADGNLSTDMTNEAIVPRFRLVK